jgi:hypothetical protein
VERGMRGTWTSHGLTLSGTQSAGGGAVLEISLHSR